MRFSFSFVSCVLLQVAAAQQNTGSVTPVTAGSATITTASGTVAAEPVQTPSAALTTTTQRAILEYKSVYESETLEEELKLATERFSLTPAQQEMWMEAAVGRRAVEKQAREKLATKDPAMNRDNIYLGVRQAQNTFHETVIGYFTPAQKQALETDRLILEDKRRIQAKLPPPPPPPPPTVTVAPVDSAAIKKEQEALKKKSKKRSKKKG